MGSASESEYHLLLANDLKLLQPQDYKDLAQRTTEVKRMLAKLLEKLRASNQ
jgi:four helix bundle protein